MAAAIFAAVSGAWLLNALGRGEFDTAHFELEGGRTYVELARASRPHDPVGIVKKLPKELTHLSVDGEVLVWGDDRTGVFGVEFWKRRGFRTVDAYVYLEGPRPIHDVYPEADTVESIAPGWFFITNG